MIVTLIGYRGCGKSSVGPLLAARLGCDCVDSDDVVEQSEGKSIADIFAGEGEGHFRALETATLTDLLSRNPIVIAAGGGVILAEINRKRMKAAGPVVWLQAAATTLASRIEADQNSANRRPSLTGQSIQAEVEDVLKKRQPLYEDAATLIVDAETDSPKIIADRIFRTLNPVSTGENQ